MVQVTETKTFALQGWAGGLNSENQRHLRAPDEAEISDYNLGPRGEVVVRLGLDRLAAHDTWTGGNVRLTSLFPYTPDAGATRYLIAVDLDGKVWRTNAGPGSTISACLSAGVGNPQVDLGATTIVSDATTLGGYFVLTREDGHAWKWDGSGGATWVEITDHALDDNGVEGTWE